MLAEDVTGVNLLVVCDKRYDLIFDLRASTSAVEERRCRCTRHAAQRTYFLEFAEIAVRHAVQLRLAPTKNDQADRDSLGAGL